MRRYTRALWPGCCAVVLLLGRLAPAAENANPTDDPEQVFIVAGQSNILNWHAAAKELAADPRDARVPLFYHMGAPPGRGYDQPFNATSRGAWTTLGPQRQEPFVKWERDFFGPEITLARALTGGGAGRVAIIKIGYFGTNLAEDWAPDSQTGPRLYALMQSEIRRALAARGPAQRHRLAGFFWMQGETDGANHAHARDYADNLAGFVARLRHDLAAPDLPVVLARVGPVPSGDKYQYQDLVRLAQSDAPRRIQRLRWVDTDDLPRDADGIHLLAPGVMALGERWALEWLALTRKR